MKNKVSVTLYHAAWCHYCTEFEEEWKKLKEKLRNVDIEGHKIDIDSDESLKNTPVPKIMINDGETEREYTGNRNADEIFDAVIEIKKGGITYSLQQGGGINYRRKYRKYKRKYINLKNKL